jgi:hypothetical protein
MPFVFNGVEAGLNFQRRPVGSALERDRWKKIVEEAKA